MIKIKKDFMENYIYSCQSCHKNQIFRKNMRAYCVWCSVALPNIMSIIDSEKLRVTYHFNGEINNVPVQDNQNRYM